MSTGLHSALTNAEIHAPWRAYFADRVARLADATAYTTGDVGKAALQTDDGSMWYLAAATPTTWAPAGCTFVSRTVSFVDAPSDTVRQLLKAPNNYRLVDVRLRASCVPTAGTLSLYRDTDGSQTNQLTASSYALTALVTNTETSLSALLTTTTGARDYANAAWHQMSVANLALAGATHSLDAVAYFRPA